jgi:hypothetical protein
MEQANERADSSGCTGVCSTCGCTGVYGLRGLKTPWKESPGKAKAQDFPGPSNSFMYYMVAGELWRKSYVGRGCAQLSWWEFLHTPSAHPPAHPGRCFTTTEFMD